MFYFEVWDNLMVFDLDFELALEVQELNCVKSKFLEILVVYPRRMGRRIVQDLTIVLGQCLLKIKTYYMISQINLTE